MARYVLFANLTAQRFLSRMEKRISRPSSEGERAVQYGYWTNPDGTPVSKPQNCLFLTTDCLSFELNRLKPRKNLLGRYLEPISVHTQTISVPTQAESVAPQAISPASQAPKAHHCPPKPYQSIPRWHHLVNDNYSFRTRCLIPKCYQD